MFCIDCKEEKREVEMSTSLGRNGKNYINKTCKKCKNKKASVNLTEKRKIVDSKEWLYKRSWRIKYNAKARNIEFSLTDEEIKSLYLTKRCYYCREKTIERTIDRVNNQNGYHFKNCVMACKECNCLKWRIVASQKKKMLKILKKL